jgi:hypothetical protein
MCGSFIRFSTPVYPGAQWVLSLYFRNHLLDFLVTRAKTFRGQPPADYDPLHPPLVKPGLESEPEEAKPKKRPAAN